VRAPSGFRRNPLFEHTAGDVADRRGIVAAIAAHRRCACADSQRPAAGLEFSHGPTSRPPSVQDCPAHGGPSRTDSTGQSVYSVTVHEDQSAGMTTARRANGRPAPRQLNARAVTGHVVSMAVRPLCPMSAKRSRLRRATCFLGSERAGLGRCQARSSDAHNPSPWGPEPRSLLTVSRCARRAGASPQPDPRSRTACAQRARRCARRGAVSENAKLLAVACWRPCSRLVSSSLLYGLRSSTGAACQLRAEADSGILRRCGLSDLQAEILAVRIRWTR